VVLAVLAGLGGPASVAADAPPAVTPAPGLETTQVGGDATRRGWISEGGFRPPFRLAWRFDLGRPVERPVIGGGRVYVATGSELLALDLASGRELWRVPSTLGPPVYGGGLVVVSGQRRMVARDAATGSAVWSASPPGGPKEPLIAGDLVITQSLGLHAFDLATGAPRWSVDRAHAPIGLPAAAGDRVYAEHVDGACSIAAFDRRTGAELWTRPRGCPAEGGPSRYRPVVVHRDMVLAPQPKAYETPLRALDGGPGAGADADAFAGGIGLRTANGLEAVDLVSGRSLWQAPPRNGSDVVGRRARNPLVIGDTVVDPRFDGALEVRGLADGRVRWAGYLPAPPQGRGFTTSTEFSFAAGRGTLVLLRGGVLEAVAAAPAGAGRVPVHLPRRPYAPARSSLTVSGRFRRGLQTPLALAVDEYPYRGFGSVGRPTVPDRRGNYALRLRVERNTRVRVVDTGGGTGPSRTFTIFAYPRIDMSFRNRGGRVTGRITVKGSPAVRFRGRRVVMYHGQASRRRMRRIGSGRIQGPRLGTGRATVRFRAIRGAGRRDFVFACIPGIDRVGQGPADAVQRRCGHPSIRF
jgi:outer membrane protein assembly factor BamB